MTRHGEEIPKRNPVPFCKIRFVKMVKKRVGIVGRGEKGRR